MIITWDTETRGLFGPIFLMGMYDGKEFSFVDPEEFIRRIKLYPEPVYCYSHNLDFDFRKLFKALNGNIEVDWDKTLVVNYSLVRVKLKGRNVWLCDSFKLFPSSLDRLSKDFELETPKMDLSEYIKSKGYITEDGKPDREAFFKNVDPEDPVVREYLRCDCISLYQLLKKAMDFAGFTEEELVKCPTLPSLAMAIYKKHFAADYKKVTERKMTKDLEEFSRRAYLGARVEVVKPVLEGHGYHYDVNSLYPYVMWANTYPVGEYVKYSGVMAEYAYKAFKEGVFKHCIVAATVEVPDTIYIPPLPVKHNGKLLFPTGILEGYWTGEELSMAEEYGAKVLGVYEGYFWKQGDYIFRGFIEMMKKEKMEGKGARRNFFKMIQNSLYGKFGMRRERKVFYNYSEERKAKFEKKQIPYLEVSIPPGRTMLMTIRKVNSSYIRPYIAAYVTSYARMFLYRAIMQRQEHVYYYDTDSLVLDKPLPSDLIDEKEYGKWKLERELKQALFLQPKFYAEIAVDNVKVYRSKGLIGVFKDTVSYDLYEKIYEAILRGYRYVELYSDIPAARKFITAIKEGKDPDEPVYLRKRIDLRAFQKRDIDYINNTSRPWNLQKLDLMREEEEYRKFMEKEARRAKREEQEYKKAMRKLILEHGGVNDPDYEDIPRWARRKKGRRLDELAINLGMDTANEVYQLLWAISA